MSEKIEKLLEDLRIGDNMESPRVGKRTTVKARRDNAYKMANDLSRLVLDLANAVQNLDRNGNTINVPDEVRKNKILRLQNSLELALGRISSKLNTNVLFGTKKKRKVADVIREKGKYAFSEEEWEKAYRRKMEKEGTPVPERKRVDNDALEDFRQNLIKDLNKSLSRKDNLLPNKNSEYEMGRERSKMLLTKSDEDYEDLFVGGSVAKSGTNTISLNRFKELLLDKDIVDSRPGSEEAKDFARDCVRFSAYIKHINNVPSGAPQDAEQLKHGLDYYLRSNKRKDDYGINDRRDSLKNLYDQRDEKIKEFENIAGDEYSRTSFDILRPSEKNKLLEIVKEVERLEQRIGPMEKEEERDYRARARAAEKNRYDTLRGNRDTSKEKLVANLSRSEKAEKFFSGINAMGLSKINSINKTSDDKILELRTSPIEGCTNVKELTKHWVAMGVPKNHQIKIIKRKLEGSQKFLFYLNGKYYQEARNNFVLAARGGIAVASSPYKDYTVYVVDEKEKAAALSSGKVTKEELDKFQKFNDNWSKASVMTEGVEEFTESLHNLKMNGVFGKATKKGIAIEYKGQYFLIPNDCSKFPNELRRFKKDIINVFKDKTHGRMDRDLNSNYSIRYTEPYKVGQRIRKLINKL